MESLGKEQSSPCLPKTPQWQEEHRLSHHGALSSQCWPLEVQMVPTVLTPPWPDSASPAAGSCSFPVPPTASQSLLNTNRSRHCRCFGDTALCPRSGGCLFAVFSALLILSVKESAEPVSERQGCLLGSPFCSLEKRSCDFPPTSLSAFNLVSTGRLKIQERTRREGACWRVPGVVLLPRFLQNRSCS